MCGQKIKNAVILMENDLQCLIYLNRKWEKPLKILKLYKSAILHNVKLMRHYFFIDTKLAHQFYFIL